MAVGDLVASVPSVVLEAVRTARREARMSSIKWAKGGSEGKVDEDATGAEAMIVSDTAGAADETVADDAMGADDMDMVGGRTKVRRRERERWRQGLSIHNAEFARHSERVVVLWSSRGDREVVRMGVDSKHLVKLFDVSKGRNGLSKPRWPLVTSKRRLARY